MKSVETPAESGKQVVTLPKRRSLRQLLLYGGAILGLAAGLERVFAFLAAMLAARISGPQTFGGYSVVLATAGTIAAYAGAGIGITAIRFSGDYPREGSGYRGFVRVLMTLGISSAAVAAFLMFVCAAPIARWMLGNEGLTAVLRVAAISSAAIVLLECCRGLLLGQQKFYGLLVLSLISGIGLVIVLPLAARINAGAMIAGQGTVALLTVLICVSLSRSLGIKPLRAESSDAGPGIRPVLTFGLVQFSAFAGLSIATWCVASLVARSDHSLTQMGFYAVSNQFRGLAAIAPGLLAQIVYSSLTNESGAAYGGVGQVLLSSTIITTIMVTMVAGFAMIVLPWVLPAAYGSQYLSSEVPVLLLLATAIIHMSGQAGAQRLSIVRLRATGAINACWALLLIALGFLLIPRAGATGAALAFLVSHTVSNALVIVFLHREGTLPSGYITTLAVATAGAFMLAALGYGRALRPSYHVSLTIWLALICIGHLSVVTLVGIRNGSLPQLSFRGKEQPQNVPSLSET